MKINIYRFITIIFTLLSSVIAFSAEKSPPLILEPNKYSYTFGVPENWDFSFEQANEIRVRLVFFPSGVNFHESNTIIYVNEICPSNCAGIVSAAIQKTINEAKAVSPNLKVESETPLKIKSGGEAHVRILTGSIDPRQAKEALAFIEHKETIVLVVLTTNNTQNWGNDYKAFTEILNGHKFFNCDSNDLAVRCR